MTLAQVQKYTDQLMDMALTYAPKLVLAIITLIFGLWLIKKLIKVAKKLMDKHDVDPSLRGFLSGLISIGLKVLLLISVASMVGVQTTSFIAVLGAAGLAVGLALQGSLSNFAGGVLILLFKPFKVGDFIESKGVMGTVESITILNTIIRTAGNNTAILPNGSVANDNIINFTKLRPRRVDLSVGIGYKEDIDKAKAVIMKVMEEDELVLKDPAPFVGVLGMGDSSVDLAIRPHCDADHYWDVFFGINEKVKKALDANNIEIPYPQRDVNFRNKMPS
jgi:small conductance mechanosensitive channel